MMNMKKRITPYTNPVLDRDAPDPSGAVKGEDGFYYIVSTQSIYDGDLIKLPILRSADLVHWELAGQVFEKLPEWLHQEEINLWAPDFIKLKDKYYVYYSGKSKPNDDNVDMAIGVAVADHPLGPYKDKGGPVVSGPTFTAIDSFVFTDDGGKRYFYWGSGFEPITVQELSEDGMTLIGEKKAVLPVDPGTQYERLLEASWVIKRQGYYYLFVSGDNCCGDYANYAVMVARSESHLGPFVKYRTVKGGGPILEANDRYNAPGHNSIITDEAGQDWILYHAIDREQPQKGRILLMDKIEWKDGWPIINQGRGPTNTQQTDGPVTFKE
jgi:arabinan endo-1,5-alpha-L-arabinosidase